MVHKTIGGGEDDFGSEITVVAGGGYLFVGSTESFGPWGNADESDAYMVRTDENGDTLWTRIFGGPAYQWFDGVAPTDDGGWIAAGSDESNGSDILVVKVSSNGTPVWIRRMGAPTVSEYANAIIAVGADEYMIVGSRLEGSELEHLLAIKIAGTGDVIWTVELAGTLNLKANDAVLASDGGYLLVGWHYSPFDLNDQDLPLVKLDPTGAVEWDIVHEDASEPVYGNAIDRSPDGRYVVVGGQGNKMAVWQVDTDGSIIWNKAFAHLDGMDGLAVEALADRTSIITGTAYDFNTSFHRHLALLLDTTGAVIAQGGFSIGPILSASQAVTARPAGGFAILGFVEVSGIGQDHHIDLILTSSEEHGLASLCDDTASLAVQVPLPALSGTSLVTTLPPPVLPVEDLPLVWVSGYAENLLCASSVAVAETVRRGPGLQIYPDPTTDQITIVPPSDPFAGRLIVVNAFGSEVFQHTLTGPYQVDVSGWTPGCYNIRLISDRDRIAHAKFVVQ